MAAMFAGDPVTAGTVGVPVKGGLIAHETPAGSHLLLLGACGQSQSARGAPASGAVTYDIAGVRPGMSLDDARKALETRGYAIKVVPGQPWDNALAIAVAQARGAPSPEFNAEGGARRLEGQKAGENISIEPIRPGPNGGIVIFVSYSAPLAAHPMSQIQAASIAKFGKPTRTYSDGGVVWCASGSSCNPQHESRPWLQLSRGRQCLSVARGRNLNGGPCVQGPRRSSHGQGGTREDILFTPRLVPAFRRRRLVAAPSPGSGRSKPAARERTPLGRVALDIRVRHPVAKELPAVLPPMLQGFDAPVRPTTGTMSLAGC